MFEQLDRPFVVLGAGGHAGVVIDLLKALGCSVLGVSDCAASASGSGPLGVDVLGDDQEVMEMNPSDIYLAMGVGSVGRDCSRTALYQKFVKKKFVFPPLLHPSSIVSRYSEIGNGSQVMAGAVVQTSVCVGVNCIINTHASVDHDCHIGNGVHIAPGVVLSGGVCVGNDVHVGTGARIIQSINIAHGAVVGAGVIVLKDVPEGMTLRARDASVCNG